MVNILSEDTVGELPSARGPMMDSNHHSTLLHDLESTNSGSGSGMTFFVCFFNTRRSSFTWPLNSPPHSLSLPLYISLCALAAPHSLVIDTSEIVCITQLGWPFWHVTKLECSSATNTSEDFLSFVLLTRCNSTHSRNAAAGHENGVLADRNHRKDWAGSIWRRTFTVLFLFTTMPL